MGGSCMQISDQHVKLCDDSTLSMPLLFRCSCGFSPSTEAGLKRHLDQSSNRSRHKRVQVRFTDSDTETEEMLPDAVVPGCEPTILQDGKEQMQETVSKSGEETLPKSGDASHQTELEDHIAKAKRWLKQNQAARIQKKLASSADKFEGQAPLNDTVNPEITPPLKQLSKSQRWLEENKAARIQKKVASSVEKLDEHTLQKRHVDPEVALWLTQLHKSLGLVAICQRRNMSTLDPTNDKLEKPFEKIRNYRQLRPGLWPDSCSRAKLKRGKWESQADVKAAQKARKEAAILLTSGIERVYGSTMLGFSRQ